ncbi:MULTISPECIES: Uma2 family endonuclease [Nocardia]|uniref:Uma2 family endonuclease n=1 Tax=Nocardia TaxID=1817 RepID=UPI0024567681|nr:MULTISPECIES: Uma2 family endonuclease [Nocardia]
MTVDVTWPDHLLTLEDWIALPEDSSRSYELVEGVLVVSPRPVLRHQFAVWQLAAQIHPQLPHELAAVAEAELVVDPAQPPTVRVPDVLVIRRKALADDLARVQPEDVKLAVEILSAGPAAPIGSPSSSSMPKSASSTTGSSISTNRSASALTD